VDITARLQTYTFLPGIGYKFNVIGSILAKLDGVEVDGSASRLVGQSTYLARDATNLHAQGGNYQADSFKLP
jgi:hypothetical protein